MNRKRLIIGLVIAGAIAVGGGLALRELKNSAPTTHTVEAFSDTLLVDPEQRSMPGPISHRTIEFPHFVPPELVWITGYRAEVVLNDGSSAPQELICHSNLDFDSGRHSRLFDLPIYHTDRLFTLSQGRSEVRFPEGFGLPFYSDEVLKLTSQVSNLDPTDESRQVRHRVAIDYVLDRDLEEPMKALFVTSGRDLELPYDTSVHYISMRLHPNAASVELRDLSNGETVFRSDTEKSEDRSGSKRVGFQSSLEGIKVYEDHEYEMISTHEDTTSEDRDSMAVMLLYLRDKQFKKRPRILAPVAHVEEPVKMAPERLVLQTNYGDIRIGLFPEVAPRHVARILELARLGIYDGVPFYRVEPGYLIQLGYPESRLGPPLTPEQKAAIRPLESEFTDMPHRRLTVAMALHDNANPNSAEASFFILLRDARELDQQFTIVGRVLGGGRTLHQIVEVPLNGAAPVDPVYIEKVSVMTQEEILEFYGRRDGRTPVTKAAP